MRTASEVVRRIRAEAGLSLRALSRAAEVASSTVHRIEKGQMQPTVETLQHIAEAAGARLAIDARSDYAVSLVGFARHVRDLIAGGAEDQIVRTAAEFASRFRRSEPDTRRRMIAADPPETGDPRWDVFLAGLAEWLATGAGVESPGWVRAPRRFLNRGWWVAPLRSLRAWEYAGTPVAFQMRGVYLHRESLTNV